MQLVKSFIQAEENAIRFSEVLTRAESKAFARLGQFFHWYYFPDKDVFAPSKFIGYVETTLESYEGLGTGTDTTRALKSWFHKLDKYSPMYLTLEARLSKFLTTANLSQSVKVSNGTGRIYVPIGTLAVTNFPDQVTDEEYFEGAAKSVVVNAYERNPKARAECIAHYGCTCSVCNFDFNKKYGEIGHGFIHVHHLKELSLIGKEYVVDPVADLRPLCPNCHAMAHMTKPAMPLEDLKRRLQEV